MNDVGQVLVLCRITWIRCLT